MNFILINFENPLDTLQRDEIERALNIAITSVRNITPVPREGMTIEEYAYTVVKNLLDPENEWSQSSAFIIRPPDAAPVFFGIFMTAFDAATEAHLAILRLQYTDDFPPEIDPQSTYAISLQHIRKRARQLRYTPEI